MIWNDSSLRSKSSKILQTLGLCLLTSTSLNAAPSSSAQEAYFLKRITEYWKEGDYTVAKSQILTFLEKYPNSSATESLHLMAGDLYLQERKYGPALEHYQQLQQEESKDKVAYSIAICLFETKNYSKLIEHVTRLQVAKETGERETLEFFLAESLVHKGLEQSEEDEKRKYLAAALPHYKQLLNGKYKEYSLAPAAEISDMLGHKEDACHYYSLLVEKSPDRREELLFKIASLQKEFKPKEAIKTYGQVYKLHGKKAPDAALLQLQLLFNEQKYRELLLFQEEALQYIPIENQPLVHYWIGKSLFYLEDFKQASHHLCITYDSASLSPSDTKLLRKSLLTCAARTKDNALLSKLIADWEATSPQDNDLAEAYLLQYQLLSMNHKEEADKPLLALLERFPNYKEKETILFNIANIQYQQKLWSESALSFTALLAEFPLTKFSAPAYRHRINCAIEEIHTASLETSRVKKESLALLLKEAFSKDKIFTPQEKKDYHFSYCRLLTELGKEEEALAELQEYVENYPKDERLGQVYYMLALCHSSAEEDLPLFISYAEKALSIDDTLTEKALLHTKLYNGYLSLAASSVEDKASLVEKAADHLFAAYQNGSKVKKDNLLWLSNYFYEQAKQEMAAQIPVSCAEKTIQLFEDLLGIHQYPPSIKLSTDLLSQESEMLKLSEVLGWINKNNEKIDVLEVLVYQQKNQPDLPWKLQRKALLDLARAYRSEGKSAEALQTYDYLITSSAFSSSYVSYVATLERARLKFESLHSQTGLEGNKEWSAVLDELKDLELKKKLSSEPLHLEAALQYVEYKTHPLSFEDKREKTIRLLELMKENFSSQQDPSVQEYLSAAAHFPDKATLHDNYMKLISAIIYRTKAEIAEQKEEKEEAKQLFFQASKELQSIKNPSQLPSDLLNRIRSNTEALENRL